MCAIDLFSKYALVASLKYKRGITIFNAIHKIISKGRKPKKIWVDQGGEFYNKLLKRFLKINNIKTDSTYNKVNSVFAERFIIMLKNKISNHITVFSKNVYFDVLYDVISNASSCWFEEIEWCCERWCCWKTAFDKLAANVNNIDTSAFVFKTKYQTDKTELEKKNPDVADFVKKIKLIELENKITDISSLVTKTALTAVETKIPNVNSLVTKTNYNTNIS